MRLLVSTRKGLFVFAGGDGGWRIAARHFLGDNVTLSLVDRRSGRWYAALDHGHFGVKLHRSDDGGGSWQEIATPAYPQRSADDPEEIGADGKPYPWTLKLIWSLETGGEREDGVLWCGTLPGGLFRSADHGATWELVRGLWDRPERLRWFGGGAEQPGIHSICVDPRDPRRIRLAISSGGVWRSDDGGASWRNTSRGLFATYMPPEQRDDPDIQDVHRMVQCRAQPDRLWIQHHNGVFRSVDGGETWTPCDEVRPSAFGFAIAVHPRDGDRAWTVPAIKDERRIPCDGRVVVSRTRDGGATWTPLVRGLPQEDAYDIAYRHALDVAADGERLAFGSTTGAMWVSADGGDSWRELSAHLPPVYALRWID